MHRISQSSLQFRQKQALIIQKHGCSLEVFGQDLQRRKEQSAQLSGQLIKECGRSIQQKAQESLMYTELLLQMPDLSSKGLDEQAIEAQAEARTLYMQALEIYLQIVQQTLRAIEQQLQSNATNNHK